jgi:SnoaL-like domain
VGTAAAALLLFVLCAAPSTVAAQEWDPAATVSAYSAALNAHDLVAALALFDENASATDKFGHHFEGRAGLTEFLLASGFGSPDARITTDTLLIVANRAIWTYSCSCADGSTEVRLVMMNHNKISVFAMVAQPAPPVRRATAGLLPWLAGLGLLSGTLAGSLILRRRRSAAPARRAGQGRLLVALAEGCAQRREAVLCAPDRADSDRVVTARGHRPLLIRPSEPSI